MTKQPSHQDGGTDSNAPISRRSFLRATGATGAVAMGLGSAIGPAAAGIKTFEPLSVSSDNRIVDGSGNTFKMRGLNIPDPKRLAITKHVRGKNADQIIDLITNSKNGWHPRVIRVPAQPTDIGEHPNGNTGPKYTEFAPEVVDDPEVEDDRRLQRPPQPKAFNRKELKSYLSEFYDPVVQKCKNRGVYCIVDFHRHWHEQPPGNGQGNEGPTGDANAENHLPYDSKYTNYWASNEFYGTDKPASWGWVDQTYRNSPDSQNFSSLSELKNATGHPYTSWEVNQELVDEAVMFWDEVAKRYADEPHVIFEPYNEPTAPGIWGPVEGCGALKQIPLWNTFREDFAQPIMNAVRNHAPEKLMLMGLPGWCQGTQALWWGDFNDLGFENVGVVWHNYAGHGTSAEEMWLAERATGCSGWEPRYSQAIQQAYKFHPVAVTEFGWQDPEYTAKHIKAENFEISDWLDGKTGAGSTEGYGEPFLKAMESDDRISWVAWCADPRWLTAMFRVDFQLAEGSLNLNDGNWYETKKSQIPNNCPDLPCDWKLWQNPNMGAYVKNQLKTHKDDKVPFETGTVVDPDGPSWPDNATDPDGDGEFEDLNGTGGTDFDDVVEYFNNMDSQQMKDNKQYYDFNDNGKIDFDDVVELFGEVK